MQFRVNQRGSRGPWTERNKRNKRNKRKLSPVDIDDDRSTAGPCLDVPLWERGQVVFGPDSSIFVVLNRTTKRILGAAAGTW